jgi:cyclopropane-fatty-acyl-phospholipid synthase
VAVAAGPPGRAAVARVLFGTAIVRLPVRVLLPDGSLHGAGGPADPVMHLHRPREFFRRLGASGLIGFGESYLAGEWDSTDLTGLLTVFAAHATELVPPWLQRLRRLAVRRHPLDDLQTIPGAAQHPPRPGRGGAGLPVARGRHRLGRAGHPGRPPRRHRAHDHDLP